VNELVLVRRQAIYLAFHEQRHLAELEFAVGTEPRLRRSNALLVANLMGLLDLSSDLFLIFFAYPAVLDPLGERVNVGPVGVQQAQHGVHGSDDLAIAARGQPANDIAELGGDFGR